MRLHWIETEGFKSLKNKIRVEFDERKVILVRGENGSGKSNFLQAIVYLFTDELDVNLEDAINWGSKKCVIESGFNIKGNEFKYKITLKKSGKQIVTERSLFINDDPEEITGSACVSELKKYINPELLLYSSVSQQLSGTDILFEKPAPRLEKLKTILGMDVITEAVSQLKDEVKTNKKNIEVLQSELNILEQLEFNYEDEYEIESIEETQVKYDQLKKEIDENSVQEKKYNEYSLKLVEYESKLKGINNKKQLIDLNEKKLIDLKNTELQKVDPVSDGVVSTLKSDISILEESSKGILKSITQKQNLESSIESNKSKLKALTPMREPICDTTQDDINNLLEKISKQKSIINDLTTDLQLFDEGICSKCRQPVHSDKSEITDKLSIEKNNLDELNMKYSESKTKLENYNNLISKYNEYKQNKTNLKLSILESEKELEKYSNLKSSESVDAEIKNKKDQLSTLQSRQILYAEYSTKRINLDSQISELESVISKEKSELSELELNLVEPDKVDKPIETDTTEFESLKEKIVLHESRVRDLERIRNHNTETKKKENETKKSIGKKRLKIDDLLNDNELKDRGVKFLGSQLASHLIEKGMTFIEIKMNEFFQKAYKRFSVYLRQDKNSVNFFYSEDGERMAPVNGACGSEKEILAEAFRVALSKIHNLGFFILDEIDTATSDTTSQSLYKNIMNLEFEQLFCVTHRESTQIYLENNFNTHVIDF